MSVLSLGGRERDRGFTLVEVLVVVIVFGILAAVATPVYLRQRTKAVDASLRADLRQLAQAEETYLVDHPDQHGMPTWADVAAAKYVVVGGRARGSSGNTLFASVNPTRGGYCLAAQSSGDSGGPTDWIFYDSGAGGFLNSGKHLGDGIPPVGQSSIAVSCNTGRQYLS